MKKIFVIPILLIVFIVSFFYSKEKQSSFPLTYLKNPCEIIVLNKLDTKQIYITLIFKNAGVLHNTDSQHGISALISKLLFRKIGGLTAPETEEKIQQLGITNLSVNGLSDHFIISFSVVEEQFKPATEFLISGLKEKFSENDLRYVKEFFPTQISPEDSLPDEILLDKLYQNLYPNHVYGKNVTGSSDAIAKITLEDIDNFIQNNFALDNLKICYAGKYSIEKLRIFTDNLSKVLLKKSNQNKILNLQGIKTNCSDEKILNSNIRDICGITTGIRMDHLSKQEKAALFIIADALFNENDGEFFKEKIPMNFSYTIEDRQSSTVLILSAFVFQKDLDNYLKKQSNFFDNLDLSQLKNLELSQKYFIQKQRRKINSLHFIHNSLIFLNMPFSNCNNEIYKKILKTVKQPNNRCTVFISSK